MNVQELLDIQIVGSEDNLKQHLLIYSDEFLVPFTDIGCALASVVLALVIITGREWLATVMCAVFKNLQGYEPPPQVGERKTGALF